MRDNTSRDRRQGKRRGVAATELAVLLPVLLLIVLACVDFGRFAFAYLTVTGAARAGAGYGSSRRFTAATQSKWEAGVRQAAVDDASSLPGFDSSKITIAVATESGGLWRAEVTTFHEFTTLVNWPGIPSSTTLTRTVQMRGTR